MHSPDAATQALLAQARRLDGAAPRARLGLNTDLEAIALGDSGSQLALLVATVRALATNSISASTAGALTDVVRAAAQIVQNDQGGALRELAGPCRGPRPGGAAWAPLTAWTPSRRQAARRPSG